MEPNTGYSNNRFSTKSPAARRKSVFHILYRALGIEPEVAQRLPASTRGEIDAWVTISFFLALFIGTATFLFLNYLFLDNAAVNIAFGYLIAGSYFLVANLFNNWYLRSWSYHPPVYIRIYIAFLMLLGFFLLFLAVIASSININKKSINNDYKKTLYQGAHQFYNSQIRNIIQTTAPARASERLIESKNFIAAFLSRDDRFYTDRDRAIDSINNEITQNFLKLDLFALKIKTTEDTLRSNSYKLDALAPYPEIRSNDFIVKKSDSLSEFDGIIFSVHGDIKVRENYHDSIYLLTQKMEDLQVLLKEVRNASRLTREQVTKNNWSTTNIAIQELNGVTKTWLQKLLAAENEKPSLNAGVSGFFRLLRQGDGNIGYISSILAFIVCMSWLYQVVLVRRIRKSEYPGLLYYYRRSQRKAHEELGGELKEKEVIIAELTSQSNEVSDPQLTHAISMIRNEGSIDSYVTLANIYRERNDFKNEIKWLESGLNAFKGKPENKKDPIKLLTLLMESYRSAGDHGKLRETREKYNGLTIADNMNKKIRLNEFEIHYHHYYNNCRWRIQPGINVLLGKNGYGKSHLITILLAILQNDEDQARKTINGSDTEDEDKKRFSIKITDDTAFPLTAAQESLISSKMDQFTRKMTEENKKDLENGAGYDDEEFQELLKVAAKNEREKTIKEIKEEETSIWYIKEKIKSNYGKIPILAIPDTRFIDKSVEQIGNNSNKIDIARDGAKHFIYQIPFSSVIENFYFDTCAEMHQLSERAFGQKLEDPPAIELIKDIYKKLTDVTITSLEVEKKSLAVYEMFVTTDELIDRLPIQKVSQGTFSIIAILGIILSYLKLIYGPSLPADQLKLQHGIVIIDELDAHIHPSWQQKLINILRETFPNVQFIITAHSPFIVAGCNEMEVAVLQKDPSSKKFSILQYSQHFIGYSPDQLCKLIFEVEKYDENYLMYANQTPRKKELTKEIDDLKNKVSLKPNEKESLEQKQKELYKILKAENRNREQNA